MTWYKGGQLDEQSRTWNSGTDVHVADQVYGKDSIAGHDAGLVS